MSTSPFDFLNSINSSKSNLIRDEGRGVSEYTPYLINKGLSQFPDTIMFANELNARPHMDKQMQYEFLLHSVRPRKRIGKWAKKEDAERIQKLVEIFGISIRKAEEMLNTLDAKTIEGILVRGSKMHGGI
jgi:hypothetical protein